jgi:hypothetical protein
MNHALARLAVAAVAIGATVGPNSLGNVVTASATTIHSCPSNLAGWQTILGADWLDCHQVSDLTTTGNPWTDPSSLYGMGFPPPGSGTLNSHYTNPTSPAVSGLQLDGYFPDGCNAFLSEPALTNKAGLPFIQGCTPAPGAGTCVSECHHDAQFVIRIPDDWNGHLMTAGTPGIRDAFSSDFILSDYALEKGWAYVSQDKGNMAANFYRDGSDEIGACGTSWCPAAAIQEWATRMRQATRQTIALLNYIAPTYKLRHVTRSYAAGISNGGYQARRAIELDNGKDHLYDGGVDWEGTLFLSSVPAGVVLDQPTTGYNLFTYLPTSLANYPGDVEGDPAAVAALAAVGFNPQSQPLWAYHWSIYWGLTQKIYRLEMDPEYTGYTCSSTSGGGSSCVSPPAEQVLPTDPDATYEYSQRLQANPALGSRMQSVAETGNIQRPLITLQGDQDALLPIKTDADLYAQMVQLAGKGGIYRSYVVAGGNHVDPQFDDHYGVDSYGTNVLRPMLPCVRSAIDALSAWVESDVTPPASQTIPRPAGASATDLANVCSL